MRHPAANPVEQPHLAAVKEEPSLSVSKITALRLTALVFGLFTGLVCVEIAARTTDLESRWMEDLVFYQSADVGMHKASLTPDLLYELKPKVDVAQDPHSLPGNSEDVAWWSNPRVVKTNQLGHRGPERDWERKPGTFRVACLGGSNTFGAAVSNGETWPDALERALSAKTGRTVEVWNLGVSGYVTEQKVALAGSYAEAAPDLYLFQLSNRGPRPLLLDEGLNLTESLQGDPAIYREVLVGAPRADGLLGAAWWSLASWRLLVVGLNRWARGEDSAHRDRVRNLLDARSDRSAQRSFSEFLRETETPVLVIHPPVERGEHWADEVDVPQLDLLAAPNIPATPDANNLHPGASVYSWYGDQIADHLIASGCLEGPCQWTGTSP